MAADVEGDVYVLVEHPFEYTGKDGRRVAIQPNERYRLLRRSTEHCVAGSWVCPRPLARSDSENVYEAIQDVRDPPTEQRPEQGRSLTGAGSGETGAGLLASSLGQSLTECAEEGQGEAAPLTMNPGSASLPKGHHSRAQDHSGRRPPAQIPVPPELKEKSSQQASVSASSLRHLQLQCVCLWRHEGVVSEEDPAGELPWSPPPLTGGGAASSVTQTGRICVGAASQQLRGDRMVDITAKLTKRQSRDLRGQVDEPPEPVYVNVERQPPATLPRASAAPRGAGDSVWETHTDAGTGRPYYYNPDTGVTTWESPFEATEGAASPATSPASVGSHESLETEWGQYWDEESHRVFFYNSLTGETAWEDELEDQLEDEQEMQPGLGPSNQRPPTPETDYPDLLTSYPEEDYSPVGSFSEPGPASPFVTPPGWSCHVSPDGQTVYTNNITEEQWVRLENQHGKTYFYNPDDASVQWALPQVPVPVPAPRNSHKSNQNSETPAQATPPEEKIKTLDKAGVLHRTKIVDKGKRLRKKHWSASWTVLEGGILTFFKDSKNSAAGGLRQPSKLSTPEFTVDLKGASLTWAPKDKSSKKNVLELRSRDGSEYLIQHDSEAIISTWHSAITQGIQEMVFGCPLAELCEREKSSVPRFVQQSIRAVEARGLDIDGLYRISGNLATIQKLRYKVDHDERLDLEDGHWEDVHVITGALKLFFRELPEPLFPFSHFRQFLAAIKLQDPATRFRCVRDLVRSLPAPNHDTLRVLFQHLCRVIEHGERNRMSVQNVAIVFGPTLLRPETEEASMPMTMVFQNQVVELILQQCSDIFPPH
nr:PREDICTED: rho GTPase-activating protein 27 [Bos mutus]